MKTLQVSGSAGHLSGGGRERGIAVRLESSPTGFDQLDLVRVVAARYRHRHRHRRRQIFIPRTGRGTVR